MSQEARSKLVVPGSAAAGLATWLVGFAAQELLDSATVAAICLVVGILLFLLAAVSWKPVQRQIPALGRIPFVHDYGFTTVAKGSEVQRPTTPNTSAPTATDPYARARELQHTLQAKQRSTGATITADVRVVLLRLAADGRTTYRDARGLLTRSLAESLVANWTDEAVDVLHEISADLAERFMRVAKGNGPDAIEARIRFLDEQADQGGTERTG